VWVLTFKFYLYSNHFKRKVQPTLTIQELKTIKLKQHNNNYINQLRFIKLLCDDCHKQTVLIFESRGDSNRCTPYRGKPNQYATHFSCSVYVWPSTIHISCGPRIATFRESSTDLDGSHCSREKGIPDYIPSTPVDRSTGPHIVSLPLTPSEAVGLSQDFIDDKLLGLLGPYTSM
jgi:hypothetical protein